jgi:hypothetical protein
MYLSSLCKSTSISRCLYGPGLERLRLIYYHRFAMDGNNGERGMFRTAARFMKRRLALVIAGIALLIVVANIGVAIAIFSASHHEATAWPGDSFTFWPEREWRQMEERIAGIPSSPRLANSVLGEVTYRQGTLPVYHLRLSPSHYEGRPLKVLLVSGVHGTETAGVEALLRFSETLARDSSLYPSVLIDIVPLLNPWGWVYGYRYNGSGEDVNRDFASRRTQEARLVQGLIRRDGPFDLVMDLHESKKYGYFIYTYESDGEGLEEVYLKTLASLGKPRENNYSEWIFPARDGVLQTPYSALFWIALGRSLSLDHYARLRGTAHSYTIETPLRDPFSDRVAVHLRTARAFITRLVEDSAGR